MYSALFLLGSSNFFFPSPASVHFSGLWSSQCLSLSGPGCPLVLECFCSCLGPCLAFWTYCLVLAPWFSRSPWSWSFSSGSLVPLAQAVCSTTVCLVDGFIVLCNMWVDFATVVLSARSKVCFKERTHGRIFVTVIVGGLLFQSRWYIP